MGILVRGLLNNWAGSGSSFSGGLNLISPLAMRRAAISFSPSIGSGSSGTLRRAERPRRVEL